MIWHYIEIIKNAYSGYFNYMVDQISFTSWHNYFYFLIGLSLLVWAAETISPWRKEQKIVRKDFWIDGFYMFFNFFIFSLIGYTALSDVGVELFNRFLSLFGITNLVAIEVSSWPVWAHITVLFILGDFIQWSVHMMLHKVKWMWEFHKVHHSVTEMGFAAHLRFHWMETIIYKSTLFIPMTMLGYGLQELFFLHAFNVLIGHLNHANINMDYGPLKYVLNNPKMHIWHHAKNIPGHHPNGVNFGISLSIWDYLFKTAHVPHSGRDIELGFEGVEHYPETFIEQSIEPFKKPQTEESSLVNPD